MLYIVVTNDSTVLALCLSVLEKAISQAWKRMLRTCIERIGYRIGVLHGACIEHSNIVSGFTILSKQFVHSSSSELAGVYSKYMTYSLSPQLCIRCSFDVHECSRLLMNQSTSTLTHHNSLPNHPLHTLHHSSTPQSVSCIFPYASAPFHESRKSEFSGRAGISPPKFKVESVEISIRDSANSGDVQNDKTRPV